MNSPRLTAIPCVKDEPDFENLLAVLRCETPKRPTLFEFFLNWDLECKLAFGPNPDDRKEWPGEIVKTIAFRRAGYDYVTQGIPGFNFEAGERASADTLSLNDGAVISERESFERYPWPDPDDGDYEILDRMGDELPDGMKVLVCGPGGVEENVIRLVGYENLCFMMVDDEELVADIFREVGSRLAKYYQNAVTHPNVGACISNDDWGFKTQTLLSIKQMEAFLFPWHKKIVEAIHGGGKPALLHSCGYFADVIDTLIDELKYDGRHSYEDNITPVEEAYEQLHERIAVLGGIDVDFVCRSTPEDVYKRSKAMLERSEGRGGYALGTGNSVPPYVPDENYFAMIRAAIESRE